MTSRFSSRRGFTLIELLVASAVFLILIILIARVVNHSAALSARTTSDLQVRQTARLAFGMIHRDLTPAALSTQQPHALQFRINPRPDAIAHVDTFFWQAPLPTTSSPGGLSVVGYVVLSDLDSRASAHRLQLRRVFIPPETSATPSQYLIYASPDDWTPTALREAYAPPTLASDEAAHFRGWAADGVVGLWVRAFDKDGQLLGEIDGGVYRYDSRPPAMDREIRRSTLPAFVEVSLAILPPGEYPRLHTLPTRPTGATATDSDALRGEIEAWIASVRDANPGIRSLTLHQRRFRLYLADF